MVKQFNAGKKSTTTKNPILKELHGIQKTIKAFDKRINGFNAGIERMAQWENYRGFHKKLKALVQVSNDKDKKKYSMFQPNVLHDKVTLDSKTHYKVIILVTSFAKHFERRQWIRKAWGNQTFWNKREENWQVIFNVGDAESKEVQQKVLDESNKYGDLLILDVPEDFYKLSEKIMAAMYWVYTKFSFEFAVKTDDDVFIHIQRLFKNLNTIWSDGDYIGYAQKNAKVLRGKSRYGVSHEEWPGKFYDPYCSGGGYVISHFMIERIIPHFNWEDPLKMEDAYIGHMVKLAGGEVYSDHGRFLMTNENLRYSPNFVVTHPIKTPEFREFVETKAALEMGHLKTHEVQNFNSVKAYREYKKKKKASLKTTRKTPKKSSKTTPKPAKKQTKV